MNSNLKGRRLLAFDFDNTVAATFEKSQSGMCVELACQQAVQAMFGLEGLHAFHAVGGLQNRAPGELLRVIMERIDVEWCIRLGKQYMEKHHSDLLKIMPEGKGLPLQWLDQNPFDVMGEIFVRTKLHILFEEIGRPSTNGEPWPRPMPGVREFFAAIRENGGVDVAILSSGHDQFIRRCFEMWGIPVPGVIVTDDDLRRMTKVPIQRRCKPSSYLLWLVIREWAKGYHVALRDLWKLRDRVVYLGDDNMRDGDLARRQGVPFYLYDPEGKVSGPTPGTIVFSSWHNLVDSVHVF